MGKRRRRDSERQHKIWCKLPKNQKSLQRVRRFGTSRCRTLAIHSTCQFSLKKNMNSTALLTGTHLRTYRTILQHPVSHNLKWDDVDALFRYLGQIEKESNGNMKVTRNGQTMVLHPHRTKDVSETEEVMAIRHFIERSETEVPVTAEKEM